MAVDWDPPKVDEAGSLPSFGRQLRGQLGGAYKALDDKMIGLLERLFEIPWKVDDASEPAMTVEILHPPGLSIVAAGEAEHGRGHQRWPGWRRGIVVFRRNRRGWR